MENETGIMPVQLPFSHIALKAKEKQAESASMEADIKGLCIKSCSKGDIQINFLKIGMRPNCYTLQKKFHRLRPWSKKVLLPTDQLLSITSL